MTRPMKDRVMVQFVVGCSPYLAGEKAAFPKKEAAILVSRKLAVYPKDETKKGLVKAKDEEIEKEIDDETDGTDSDDEQDDADESADGEEPGATDEGSAEKPKGGKRQRKPKGGKRQRVRA